MDCLITTHLVRVTSASGIDGLPETSLYTGFPTSFIAFLQFFHLKHALRPCHQD